MQNGKGIGIESSPNNDENLVIEDIIRVIVQALEIGYDNRDIVKKLLRSHLTKALCGRGNTLDNW